MLGRRALDEIAVADGADRLALGAQPTGEPFGGIDRAVLAAGAANGDGEIAFALAIVARQKGDEQRVEPLQEGCEAGIRLDIGADSRIEAAERPQRGNVMRVLEEADIED